MSKVTTCTGCGKTIEYITKRPIKCSTCRTKKVEVKETKPRSKGRYQKGRQSNSEATMNWLLNECLVNVDYINGGYYSFLLSPKGQPLQLDRYYPDLKLAFE